MPTPLEAPIQLLLVLVFSTLTTAVSIRSISQIIEVFFQAPVLTSVCATNSAGDSGGANEVAIRGL